jgi:hypothetical protein
MKKCASCNKEKDENSFNKDKYGKDGLRYTCRDCQKVYRKKNYYANREHQLKQTKLFKSQNKEKMRQSSKKYREENIEAVHKRNRIWISKNKDKRNEYSRNRFDNNPKLKMVRNLRRRFAHALKNNIKELSVINLIGCTTKELEKHLESKFYLNSKTRRTYVVEKSSD